MNFFDLFRILDGNTGHHFSGADRSQLNRLEQKIDLLLRHFNVQYVDPTPSSPLSREAQELARNPVRKIEAIKLYREQSGASLKEAKDVVEAFIATGR